MTPLSTEPGTGARGLLANVARGAAMGAADIVPGVSGGTIALILGIYERLLASVRTGARSLARLVRGDLTGFRRQLAAIEWSLIAPLLVGVGGFITLEGIEPSERNSLEVLGPETPKEES